VYLTAATLDVASHEDVSSLAATQSKRSQAYTRASLLTPIVKAWVSEVAVEVASLGLQIHGGMGYVEDAEISQIYRDARIGPIFEGTNYIQSQDLLGRKIIRDGGVTLSALLEDIEHTAAELPADDARLSMLRSELIANCTRLREVTAALVDATSSDPDLIGSVAHHYLQWLGVVIGGWQWCLYAEGDADTAAFYAAHVLPRARMHEAIVRSGSSAVSAIPPASI
jgi:hypothetical protein